MSRHRVFVIGAIIAALLVGCVVMVGSGLAVARVRQAQAHPASQGKAVPQTQQANAGLLPLSGTPQATSATYQKWKLESFTFAGSPQTLGGRVTAMFIFKAQGLAVYGHVCNEYGETYAWSQDHSHLIALGAEQTQMACNGDVMGLEANYLTALGRVTTYQLGQSEMTLRDATGQYVLRYVPA